MTKTRPRLIPLLAFCALVAIPCPAQTPLTVKGFQLGMSRDAVKKAFEALRDAPAAHQVSMESEAYRDLITVDNGAGSMGNKVELAYDDNGTVRGITFQHTTVDILFDAGGEDAESFVRRFCKEYGLPAMERKDQGFVTLWNHTDAAAGYKVSIDDGKNIRIQRVTDGSS
jgi:hypothetical protein